MRRRNFVNSSISSRYFWRGIFVAVGGLLAVVIISLSVSVVSYQGQCGGLFPWLAGPKPCSLMDYLWSELLFLGLIGFFYWPLLLAWCLFGPLVGYVLGRRSAGP